MPLFKLGGATGGVTSVGLTAPGSILAVTGSPVTTAGVLALALVTQAANLVWAGPVSGASANPTFRSLVAADIPNLSAVYQPLNATLTSLAGLTNTAGVLTNNGSGVLTWAAAGGTGTVTSVALTVPSILSVAGSPIMTAGTLAVSLATQNANLVFAGPSSGGAATPTFRALAVADIPSLSSVYQPLDAKLTAISALANAAGALTNNGAGVFSYTTLTTGTVTSVSLTVPSFLSVAGSPVNTSGTIAITLATETANFVFVGPASGGAATPTFRALVAADIPNLSGVYQPLSAKLTAIDALANAAGLLTNNGAGVFSYTTPTTGTVTSVALTLPSFLSVAGSPVTTSGTLAVTLATETANFVFAGPTTGGAAAPTFRALVAADIPSLSGVYQPLNTTLSSLAGLANASGFLKNNGSGTLTWSASAATPAGLDTQVQFNNGGAFGASANFTYDDSVGILTIPGLTIFTNSAGFLVSGVDGSVGYDPSPLVTLLSMDTARILGRTTASVGAVEELTAGASLSLSSGTLNTVQDIRTTATPTWNGANMTGGIASTFDGAVFSRSGASTNQQYLTFANTGGSFYLGIERSTGGALLVGSSAYATILGTIGSTALQLGTASTVRMTIDVSGNVLINSSSTSGRLTVAGVANANAAFFTNVATTSQSFGVHIAAGTNTNDYAFRVTNQAQSIDYIKLSGDGVLNRGSTAGSTNNFVSSGTIGATAHTIGFYSASGASFGDVNFSARAIQFITSGSNSLLLASNGPATFGFLSTHNAGVLILQNIPLYWNDAGNVPRRAGLWSGTNIYWGDIDNTGNQNLLFMASGSGQMNFYTNNVARMILANNGRLTVTADYVSSAPVGGTAAAWKFGIPVGAAVTFNTGQYIQLDVSGTLFKLALVN